MKLVNAALPRKLARWQKKLLKKSRKLKKMGTKKRHRLRLMNKRLCYSIEFFDELFANFNQVEWFSFAFE